MSIKQKHAELGKRGSTYPPNISGMAEATNFESGVQLAHTVFGQKMQN